MGSPCHGEENTKCAVVRAELFSPPWLEKTHMDSGHSWSPALGLRTNISPSPACPVSSGFPSTALAS